MYLPNIGQITLRCHLKTPFSAHSTRQAAVPHKSIKTQFAINLVTIGLNLTEPDRERHSLFGIYQDCDMHMVWAFDNYGAWYMGMASPGIGDLG